MRIKLTPCPLFPECLSPGETPGVYMARPTANLSGIAGVSREAEDDQET